MKQQTMACFARWVVWDNVSERVCRIILKGRWGQSSMELSARVHRIASSREEFPPHERSHSILLWFPWFHSLLQLFVSVLSFGDLQECRNMSCQDTDWQHSYVGCLTKLLLGEDGAAMQVQGLSLKECVDSFCFPSPVLVQKLLED